MDEPMCGGFSNAQQPDEDCNQIVTDIKSQVEQKLGTTFTTFKAIDYQSQVVAGTNWSVLIDVGNNKKIRIKVFEALPFENAPLELTEVEQL